MSFHFAGYENQDFINVELARMRKCYFHFPCSNTVKP